MICKIFREKYKRLLLFLFGIAFISSAYAQSNDIFICKDAFISFFSSAPVENIAAQTNQAVSAINMKTGDVYFKVPMRTFQFKRGLMQQHFNTEYLETDKYPFAIFKGKLSGFTLPVNDGTYPVTVDGQLTIHGVTKEYAVPGTLEVKNGQITAGTSFNISLADHHIKIPAILNHNIAEVLAIKVKAAYSPMNKN
ncbi:MAG: YceI family protein [Chitinophagaceae bacterium]|jgi:hypothetical protein|nr:MAG: YceI family protein [Chitinophagaceae bacterium]